MANAWKIARKSNAQLPLVIVIALAIFTTMATWMRGRGIAVQYDSNVAEAQRFATASIVDPAAFLAGIQGSYVHPESDAENA